MSQQWARSGVIGIARRSISSAQRAETRPLITQPRVAAGYSLLDGHAFRNAMNVLIARERFGFSILVIRPERYGATLALGEVILRQVRSPSGDLAGYLDAAIAVALRCADHVGAVAFADRVREQWRRSGQGELLIDIAEHPYAEQRVIELLTADWSAAQWVPLVIDDAGQRGRPDRDAKRAGIANRQ
ncbi:MAG TPA: hypothetical protein VJN70_04365 [Gemmatimonadaceae bacterium]|nr:hypothetical protein [Gemmatimonadaceae bacterium]